jgi:hypothetical protein
MSIDTVKYSGIYGKFFLLPKLFLGIDDIALFEFSWNL